MQTANQKKNNNKIKHSFFSFAVFLNKNKKKLNITLALLGISSIAQ